MTDLIKRLLVLEDRLEYLNGYKAGVEVRSVLSKPPETYAAPLTPDMPVTYTHTVGGLSVAPLTVAEIAAIRRLLAGVK